MKKCLIMLLVLILCLSGCDNTTTDIQNDGIDNVFNDPEDKGTGTAIYIGNTNQKSKDYMGKSTNDSWSKLKEGDYCVYGLVEEVATDNGLFTDRKSIKIKVQEFNTFIIWMDDWTSTSAINNTSIDMSIYTTVSEMHADCKTVLLTSSGSIKTNVSTTIKSINGTVNMESFSRNYSELSELNTADYQYAVAKIAKKATYYVTINIENPPFSGWKEESKKHSIEYSASDVYNDMLYTEK